MSLYIKYNVELKRSKMWTQRKTCLVTGSYLKFSIKIIKAEIRLTRKPKYKYYLSTCVELVIHFMNPAMAVKRFVN